jgi:hypothetical protein
LNLVADGPGNRAVWAQQGVANKAVPRLTGIIKAFDHVWATNNGY